MVTLAATPIRTIIASLMAATLVACGGGGGGGASGVSPAAGSGNPSPGPDQSAPPPETVPLQLSASNAKAAATFGLGYGAIAAAVAQIAVNVTAEAEGSPTLSFSRPCPLGGTVAVTLADRDGNRRAGAGDQLTVKADGCYFKELDDNMDGALSVTFDAPTASQVLAGTIAFEGFKTRQGDPAQELHGRLRFDYSADHLSKLVHVGSDAQAFGIRFSVAGKILEDALTLLDIQHETRADTARATTTMRFHVSSAALGGSFDVSTTKPLGAWFGTYPDAGALAFSGANNSSVGLRARATPDQWFDVVADAASVDTVQVDDIGVLWTGAPWLPQVAGADKYTTGPATPDSFKVLDRFDAGIVRPSSPLTWQFSRPLANPSAVTATLVPVGNMPPTTVYGVPEPVTVRVEGALLTVLPGQQLQPGGQYAIRLLNAGSSNFASSDGRSLSLGDLTFTVAQTVKANLVAVGPALLLGPNASLVLDANTSSADGKPASSFTWQQISGPPVRFSDTSAARPTISPASLANGLAVVEVAAANALGEVDRTRMDVQVAADLQQAMVWATRTGTAPYVTELADAAGATGYARHYTANNVLDVLLSSPLGIKRLLFSPAPGQSLSSGAKLAYGDGATVGVIGCFGTHTGTLSVLEYVTDADGKLIRLAADYDDTCSTAVTQGSIRFRSAVPLRP